MAEEDHELGVSVGGQEVTPLESAPRKWRVRLTQVGAIYRTTVSAYECNNAIIVHVHGCALMLNKIVQMLSCWSWQHLQASQDPSAGVGAFRDWTVSAPISCLLLYICKNTFAGHFLYQLSTSATAVIMRQKMVNCIPCILILQCIPQPSPYQSSNLIGRN